VSRWVLLGAVLRRERGLDMAPMIAGPGRTIGAGIWTVQADIRPARSRQMLAYFCILAVSRIPNSLFYKSIELLPMQTNRILMTYSTGRNT